MNIAILQKFMKIEIHVDLLLVYALMYFYHHADIVMGENCCVSISEGCKKLIRGL